jgi:arylsulfatase
MTDKVVAWVKYQKALTPDKPFFVYFAPGATHAPHHVPQEWIARWKGKFDQGWDKLREETLARQIKMGIVPPGTKLAPKPQAIKDWDKLAADEKRLFTRQVEVFAAYLDPTRDRPHAEAFSRTGRQHAGLLHRRRQRHERRRRRERHVQ